MKLTRKESVHRRHRRVRRKAGNEGQEPGLGVAGKGDAADAGGASVGVLPGQRGMAERQQLADGHQRVVIGGLDGIGTGGAVGPEQPGRGGTTERSVSGRGGRSGGGRAAAVARQPPGPGSKT